MCTCLLLLKHSLQSVSNSVQAVVLTGFQTDEVADTLAEELTAVLVGEVEALLPTETLQDG